MWVSAAGTMAEPPHRGLRIRRLPTYLCLKPLLAPTNLWVSSAIFSEPHLQHDTLALRDIFAPTVSCTQATSALTLALR